MPDPVYDPNTPAIAQNDDWSCAVTSARWALEAYGRQPTEQWIEATSLAEGVESRDLGLMDGTGAGLAAFITEQYAEFGYSAYNAAVVSFDDVRRVAGQSPVLVGGHDWNHWTGVRRYDSSTDTLALANPDGHWMGIGQTLNRQQFADLGPFSMVVLRWGSAPPLPDPNDAITVATLLAQVDDLKGKLAALTQQRDGLVSAVAYLGDSGADAMTALAKEWQRVRIEQVGPRP